MSGNLSKVNVLVVDDSAHIRRLLGVMLRAMGAYRISEARTAAQALDFLHTQPIDLALIDWMLDDPDSGNGMDLVRTMRRSPVEHVVYMPIIMVTGHTEQEHIEEARDAGITEFLAKPFTAKTLFSRVNALIEQPRPFVKTRSFFGPDRRRRTEGPPMEVGERRFSFLK